LHSSKSSKRLPKTGTLQLYQGCIIIKTIYPLPKNYCITKKNFTFSIISSIVKGIIFSKKQFPIWLDICNKDTFCSYLTFVTYISFHSTFGFKAALIKVREIYRQSYSFQSEWRLKWIENAGSNCICTWRLLLLRM